MTTTLSLTRESCSFPNPLLKPYITLQTPFTSCSTTTSKRTIYMAATSSENAPSEKTTSSGNTPKIPATEICILVFVYIIPFLNRLNLLSKFPVLKYAMSPIMPLLGFYQSIPTLGLIAFLVFFIGFVRCENSTKSKYPLQAMVMDCMVIIAYLVRPFLVNPVPLGVKFRLLHVLELLGSRTCIHSCLEYLGSVQWVGEEEKVNEASDVSGSFIDSLARIVEVVLKTDGNEGRRKGKSSVSKLLRENNGLLSDHVNSTETFNKHILSSCQSCLNSLMKLYKQSENKFYRFQFEDDEDNKISLEADNLLWLLDILADRQVAEEFALMWANQQKLANLHVKFRTPSSHLVSCITTRLIVGIGNRKILAAKDTRQLLLKTWFQPLVDDYSYLREHREFDRKVVEENIGRIILELPLEDQQSILLPWFECFLKKGDACPDLRKAFDGWCRRSAGKTPSLNKF